MSKNYSIEQLRALKPHNRKLMSRLSKILYTSEPSTRRFESNKRESSKEKEIEEADRTILICHSTLGPILASSTIIEKFLVFNNSRRGKQCGGTMIVIRKSNGHSNTKSTIVPIFDEGQKRLKASA